MNLLSAISIIIFTSFFIGAGHIVTAERKNVLNLSACAVLVSLGWWSFCGTFFFAASTEEQAWFWHKLGSIGWCGFAAFTAYYFFALTNNNRQKVIWWKQILFFALPAVLVCKNLFGKTTSLAQGIVQSTSGWGWTYRNSVTSFWLWAYLFYIVLYFGFAFYLLHRWSKEVKHKMKKEMAVGFIILDLITISIGMVTDVVFPLTTPITPALANIATAIFGIGYFGVIYRHDLFNINLLISPDDILQTGNNAIFVMDETKEILKYNNAAEILLGFGKVELIGVNFGNLMVEQQDFPLLNLGADLLDIETKMRCKDGTIKDVLVSASIARDKSHSFLCIIVSCQDITRQKNIQAELQLEREKYKILANDYQQLAYYDPLTGLANRRRFFDILSEFEEHYRTDKKDFAVIFMDLDNFKHVNDVYGHKGGDELLVASAQKMKSCTVEDEFVARLGGDEFMMIMPYTSKNCLDHKTKRIRDQFHQSVLFNGRLHEIKISMGCGVFSQIGDTIKLMQRADEAMYGDKKGKGIL